MRAGFQRLLLGFAAWTLLLGGNPCVAGGDATLADFKRLCMNSHGDVSAAFATADASGWQPAPGSAKNFMALSGNSDGRVMNPQGSDYRAFTIGTTVVGSLVVSRCFIVSDTPFDELKNDLAAEYDAPDRSNNKIAAWDLMEINRITKHRNKTDYLKAKKRAQFFQIFVLNLDSGSALELDEPVFFGSSIRK